MPVEKLEPPYLGMNTEAQANVLPKGQCQSSINLLPGFPGRAPLRGPLVTRSDYASGVTIQDKSIWAHPDLGILLCETSSPSWPIKQFTSVGAAPTNATRDIGGDNTALGRQSVVVGDISVGCSLAQSDGSSIPSYILVWTAGGGGSALTRRLSAPRAVSGVAYWLNRLFALAASPPGTLVPLLNASYALYWTDPMDGVSTFLPDNPAAWNDNTSGLLNQIVLDGFSTSNPPTGLAVMGRQLAVFGKRSIHVLRGSGPSDWQIRKEITGIGCVDARSIISHNDGVYFASEAGYYFYDGVSLVCVSENVREKFVGATNATAAKVTNDVLLVTVGTSVNGAGWNGLLYLPTRSWTGFAANTNVLGGGLATLVASSDNGPILSDGNRIWLGDHIAGNDGIISSYDAVGTTYYGIPGQAISRLAMLAEPGLNSQLRRFISGYELSLRSGPDDAATLWTFGLQDPALIGITDLAVPMARSSVSYTKRTTVEALGEVTEVALVAVLVGPNGTVYASNPPKIAAELHDCYIEFAPARGSGSY